MMKVIIFLTSLLLAGTTGVAPAASSNFVSLPSDRLPTATVMDDQQNVFITGKYDNFDKRIYVMKLAADGSTTFDQQRLGLPKFLQTRPNAIAVASRNGEKVLAVLANGSINETRTDIDIKGGQSEIFFANEQTGEWEDETITIEGTTVQFNPGEDVQSLISQQIIPSTTFPNRVYVIGTSVMDTQGSRYGYSIFSVDIVQKQVVWSKFLIFDDDEGGPEVALEVGNYLFVGGFQGLVRIDCSLDEEQPFVKVEPIDYQVYTLNLVSSDTLIVSGYRAVQSFNLNDLTLNWDSRVVADEVDKRKDNYGFARGPGPTLDTMWFSRTLAVSGRTSDWKLEAGVFNVNTGKVLWRQEFNSGDDLSDQIMGQFSQGSALRVIENGQKKERYRWFLWFKRTRIVSQIRMLTFDHSTQSISSIEEASRSIRYVSEVSASDSVSWGVGFDGEAVRFTHVSPAAGGNSIARPTEFDVSEVDSVEWTPAAVATTGAFCVGMLALVIFSVQKVRARRTRSKRAEQEMQDTSVDVEKGANEMQIAPKESSNPLFNSDE